MDFLGPRYSGKHSTHLVKTHYGNGVYSDYERKDSPFSTPWGRAERVMLFHRGVRLVFADRGCGFMISKKFAENYVLDEVIAKGFKYGGYICYGGKKLGEEIYQELLRIDPSMQINLVVKDKKKRTRTASN